MVCNQVQARRKGVAKAPRRKNIGDQFTLRGIATCAGCEVPLRSSIVKANDGHYPYYLCQTKTCGHYDKSVRRAKIEGEDSALIKSLQPTKGLIAATGIMEASNTTVIRKYEEKISDSRS